MKKVYTTPNIQVVTVPAVDMIVTSSNGIGYSTGLADDSEQLGAERNNPIWD